MTPIAAERIIRAGLKAVLEGDNAVESRLDAVLEKFGSLSLPDRRKVLKPFKTRLLRALRAKKTVVRTATLLEEGIRSKLKKASDESRMFFFEESVEAGLLAGFSFQTGDDRFDYSLKSRIEQLK